jgi:hypothetical protein
MRNDRPRQGGIAAVLQLIAILEVVCAFFGGAMARLPLGTEVVLMAGALVTASLLWAGATVIEELRRIEFNLRLKGASDE